MDPAAAGITALRIGVGALGTIIVIGTLISAIKTFVLPRGINVWLTAVIFRAISFFFLVRVRRASFEDRDRIMALFAPLTLFLLPVVFLVLVMVGYMCLFWSIDARPVYEVFRLSGSSLLTLGYASVDETAFKALEFSEAMIGLILVALLIAYLPTMYAAFSRRESDVAMLAAWAGTPFSAKEMIARAHRTGELDDMKAVWQSWERWFAEVEESHTSLAPLAFFRSPQPDRSWVTAAGTVLDCAALMLTAVDVKFEPRAAICIRAGYLALRHVADFFERPYPANPQPTDPISISRSEFDAVCDELKERGVPMKPDREQTWRDFAGWRVNYDVPLLQLATLTMAPYAQWVSDRSAVGQPDKAKRLFI